MIFLGIFAVATLAIFCGMLFVDGFDPYDGNPLTIPSALVILGTAAVCGFMLGVCCQLVWMIVR